MTKYTQAASRRAREEAKETPPIWRGIGCFMIVFIPFLSWACAAALVQLAQDNDWPLPYQIMGYPVLPKGVWAVSSLAPLWNWISNTPNLYAIALFTVLFIVIIGAIVSVIYAAIYKVVGPSPYGPTDVPPIKARVKTYKR